jgi:hypothetical protein
MRNQSSEATFPLSPRAPFRYARRMGRKFEDVGQVFGRCRTPDGPDYWNDPDSRHDEHRRHVRNLLIACAFFVVAATVVHPSLLVLLVLLVPFLLLELYMLRRSGRRAPPPFPEPEPPYEPGLGNVDMIVDLERSPTDNS